MLGGYINIVGTYWNPTFTYLVKERKIVREAEAEGRMFHAQFLTFCPQKSILTNFVEEKVEGSNPGVE